MIVRLSSLFFSTLREDPADAEVPSHRLLVRAGYIRRVAPGIYSWLPLGWRVHTKVEQVVREEMDAMGAQEIHLPALLPREPYETSHRWTDYGDDIFRLKDRKGNDMLLGPTHEEIFTLLVKDICSSYKGLPLSLYQIQWKYRDEARPRAGVLRGREFLMKDSYSFDLDDEAQAVSYAAHRATYMRVFDRLGLRYVAVRAHSGAMGGSASEEFMSPAEVGEDRFVTCPSCGYASNVETVGVPEDDAAPVLDGPEPRVLDTPGAHTVEAVMAFLNEHHARPDRPWDKSDALKNLAFMVTSAEGEDSVVLVGIPGDREVDLKRLEAQLYPATVRTLTEVDFARHPALVKGYIGPKAGGVRYLLDPMVRAGSRWVTGANEQGRHVVDLMVGRDFEPDGHLPAAEVREGDPCPVCRTPLRIERGIELGHIFALGRKFAEAFDLKVSDRDGKQVVVTMGSYGIGISRLVAVLAENNHDARGLIWPRTVAPADVHVIAAGKGDDAAQAAERLAGELSDRGLTVMLDDRHGPSAGERFSDADLLGVPTIVVCGRGLADGKVEVKDRATGERTDVPLADAGDVLSALCRS